MISPMCTYSAVDGMLDDFHLVHLGRFAMGGAALVFVEATAVSRRGRITHGCSGLWSDEHVPPLKRTVDFIHRFGAVAGIQLSHAGHKSSSQRPWEGGGPLGEADSLARGDNPWVPQGATASPFDEGWAAPSAMSEQDIETVCASFVDAARRADAAGIDVVEIHCAHGYLLHSFLSPISNTRADIWGGDLEGRIRFPLKVVRAVRAVWPTHKPLFVRISSVDGIDVGWSIDDSVVFAKQLKAVGVDVVDCSSGGMKLPRLQNFLWRGPGFHVPFSKRIRREAAIPTVAVGLIRNAEHAEAILDEEAADLVAVGREALFHPNWAAEAAVHLDGVDGWETWPEQFGWWLSRRARQEKDGYGERKSAGIISTEGSCRT
jgi:2,4-dienoyl-CoA reductase-like NADH-dependent reductase (Old Yellow Enzyme family)